MDLDNQMGTALEIFVNDQAGSILTGGGGSTGQNGNTQLRGAMRLGYDEMRLIALTVAPPIQDPCSYYGGGFSGGGSLTTISMSDCKARSFDS